MPPVGFESTTSVFVKVKTVHASESAAKVIGSGGKFRYISIGLLFRKAASVV
jgi:hypothetical protein